MAFAADYPAVARIQQSSPEAAQWPLGDYSACRILIALADRTPAGFCAWRQTSADEAELPNLAVDPRFRRAGVASALLNGLETSANGMLFLEVAAPNHAARALYLARGWEETGVRRGYYDHGKTDAIVMKKRSC